ncbi:Uncharacterized membrane protein [Pseudomonas pohangensis]|jgi:uncharacterized membrane protein|uniref:Uncharacterized membrane protein n=1 Tax=Pseudomonas pohangensis TaxID=364197 RepID=A0A1H2GJG8_9PSED|nr:hypothetical protein [Pseudomonas pohangensis]SDU19684.1 Uncharacterized membrane protein [Pseudomonas pohangensis]
MQEIQIRNDSPAAGLINLTHIIYGLHAFAIVTGIVGSATIVGSFLGSLPSILAVILNYVKRSETRGTWLESHFSWQIRTFWFALLWVCIAVALALTIIALPLTLCILVGLTLWVIYRIGRGWLALNAQRTVP